uniref:(California timema) hypothetical protein n=1 Tax=Timema californicum TaxID=61474 RepID=A0A7R9J974_TIMCA|nr:unnamed protein product [Timema californicum]
MYKTEDSGIMSAWKQSLLLPASFLLVSVLGSIGMAAGSVVILAPEDRISIARGAWLSLLGLVFFVSLFDLLNYVALRTHIGHMFRKKYELTLVEVLDISNNSLMTSLVLTDSSQLKALKRYQTKLCLPTLNHVIFKNMCLAANCVSSSSSIVLCDWVCGVHMVMYSEFSAFIPLYV